MHAWADEGRPLRLHPQAGTRQAVAKADPDWKALARYGLLLPDTNEVWLHFPDGHAASAVTTIFLGWCCQEVTARGKTALLLAWDNASWHGSKEVRA